MEILLSGLQGRSFSENSLHREIHQRVGMRGASGLTSAKMPTTRDWRQFLLKRWSSKGLIIIVFYKRHGMINNVELKSL